MVTANNYSPFDIGKGMKNSKQKELMLLDNDNLITINLHLDEAKMEALKIYLNDKYKFVKKVTKTNVVLKQLDNNYSYNDSDTSCEVKILNKRTETKTEKTSLFKSENICTNYGDIEYTYSYKPEVNKLLQSFNHHYIDLVDLYNYIISCKELSNKMRKSTIVPDIAINLIKHTNLMFFPMEKEKSMSNEDLKEIIDRIFDCFIIDSIEKQPINNGNISISIDLSLEELISLKWKLILAKNNSEIINTNIITTDGEISFYVLDEIKEKKINKIS